MKKERLIVFIFNLVIIALCAMSIIMYIVSPIWQFTASYTVYGDDMKEMIGESDELDIDFDEIVGASGVTIPVSITISSMDMIDTVIHQDADKAIEAVVGTNVTKIISELTATLSHVADNLIVNVASSVAKTEIKTQLKNYLASTQEGITDDEVQALLNDAGVTDAYIEQQTEALVTALRADNATVDSVTAATIGIADDVYAKLQESGKEEFDGIELTDENKQALNDTISDSVAMIADEDGNVDVDAYINTVLLGFIKTARPDDSAQTRPANATSLSSVSISDDGLDGDSGDGSNGGSNDSGNKNSDEVKAELEEEIKNFIYNMIPDGLDDILTYVFMGIGILILFSIFTWAYLVLKIIVKFFTKNPAIKLKLPIWLGWLPFLIFYGLPSLVLMMLTNFDISFLAGIQEMAAPYLSRITLSFYSSGVYAFAAAIALIVLWIFYRIFRKRLKRAKKQSKERR